MKLISCFFSLGGPGAIDPRQLIKFCFNFGKLRSRKSFLELFKICNISNLYKYNLFILMHLLIQ